MGRKLVAPISGTGHFITAEMLSGLRVKLLLMAYITQDGKNHAVRTIKQTGRQTDRAQDVSVVLKNENMVRREEDSSCLCSVCMFLPKIVSSSVFHLEKVSKNVTF